MLRGKHWYKMATHRAPICFRYYLSAKTTKLPYHSSHASCTVAAPVISYLISKSAATHDQRFVSQTNEANQYRMLTKGQLQGYLLTNKIPQQDVRLLFRNGLNYKSKNPLT